MKLIGKVGISAAIPLSLGVSGPQFAEKPSLAATSFVSKAATVAFSRSKIACAVGKRISFLRRSADGLEDVSSLDLPFKGDFLAFDGGQLWAASQSGSFAEIDGANLTGPYVVHRSKRLIIQLIVGNAGRLIALIESGGLCEVFDSEGRLVHSFADVWYAALSSDDKELLISRPDGQVAEFETKTWTLDWLKKFARPFDYVWFDGDLRAFFACRDRSIYKFGPNRAYNRVSVLDDDTYTVCRAAFSKGQTNCYAAVIEKSASPGYPQVDSVKIHVRDFSAVLPAFGRNLVADPYTGNVWFNSAPGSWKVVDLTKAGGPFRSKTRQSFSRVKAKGSRRVYTE